MRDVPVDEAGVHRGTRPRAWRALRETVDARDSRRTGAVELAAIRLRVILGRDGDIVQRSASLGRR